MASYGSLNFREQIAFFLRKVNVPTASWTDLWQADHDSGFMVAGAAKAELLQDLREAVNKAIRDGTTLEEFRKDFDEIVARHGWSYTGGRNWRTRIIYETNLRTSYAAGRYAQLKANTRAFPYWIYKHSHLDKVPRPLHIAHPPEGWNGLVLRHDDPWWDTHFPPNGWGCTCYVEGVSEHRLRKLGKGGPDEAPAVKTRTVTVGTQGPSPRTVSVPEGIDPGFGYAPGQTVYQETQRAVQEILQHELEHDFQTALAHYLSSIPTAPPAPALDELEAPAGQIGAAGGAGHKGSKDGGS